MNEVRLSCGVLTMDDTNYYEAIAVTDVCAWILSTCSTVMTLLPY